MAALLKWCNKLHSTSPHHITDASVYYLPLLFTSYWGGYAVINNIAQIGALDCDVVSAAQG